MNNNRATNGQHIKDNVPSRAIEIERRFTLYSNHRSRCFQDVNSTTGWKGLIEQKNNNVRVQKRIAMYLKNIRTSLLQSC